MIRVSTERQRLEEERRREKNWKRWGPYLSERQWGTVREDYSPDGESWHDFPHDAAPARAYRWGEDGLLGITDRQGTDIIQRTHRQRRTRYRSRIKRQRVATATDCTANIHRC